MKKGVSFVALACLHRVQIQGRGGDSVHYEYFETAKAAILASALDGQDEEPHLVDVFKLSDGSYIKLPETIRVSAPPTEEQIAKLTKSFPRAARLLLARKK